MAGASIPTAGATGLTAISLPAELAKWSAKYDQIVAMLSDAQSRLDITIGTRSTDSKLITELRQVVATLQMRLGIIKEYIDSIKERMKDFLQFYKSFSELAQGVR